MKNLKKYKYWVAMIVVVIAALGFLVWRDYFSYGAKIQKEAVQDEKYWQDLEEKYKQDDYGGETPEKTLSLFVEALNKKDADLASKYFVPQKQEEMKKEIEAGFKSGGTTKFIENFNHFDKLPYEYDNKQLYEINLVDNNKVVNFSYRFRLNPFTKKWKIESL